MIGWKFALRPTCDLSGWYHSGFVIVKLEIPDDATWFQPECGGGKCRCSKAKVLEAYDLAFLRDSEPVLIVLAPGTLIHSWYDKGFVYSVGQDIHPKGEPFDEDPECVCSSGIHFFRELDLAIKLARSMMD